MRLLKRCTDRNNVVAHINNVCKCLTDTQLAVREATTNAIQAMYPEQRRYEQDLIHQLKDLSLQHVINLKTNKQIYKQRRNFFRKRRGKHAAVVGVLRKQLRVEILKLHTSIRTYEEKITEQMQKYQHLVELMRRERINRQYQQHNDEIALHDARTALVDSDAR